MADGASSKTMVVVALIGATATIIVALVPVFWRAPKPLPPAPAPIAKPGAVQPENLQRDTSGPATQVIGRKSRNLSGLPIRSSEITGGVPANVDIEEDVALIKAYLRADRLDKAADAVRMALQKQSSNGELHACLAGLSIATGRIDQAEQEFRKAGQLGVQGMLDHAASVKVHEEALKELSSYRPGDDVTAAQWKAYDDVYQADLPGTYKMMGALQNGTGNEAERRASEGNLPNHRELNQLMDWYQASAAKQGNTYSYCPLP